MTQAQMRAVMEIVFDEVRDVRQAGQAEYAHDPDDAFANFQRAASDLNLTKEQVLWIFAMKHRDGIAAFLQGHRSQREDVRGRIKDLIMYLILLRGMIDEADGIDPFEQFTSPYTEIAPGLWLDSAGEIRKPGHATCCGDVLDGGAFAQCPNCELTSHDLANLRHYYENEADHAP